MRPQVNENSLLEALKIVVKSGFAASFKVAYINLWLYSKNR
jgi:hypothetical protein